MDASLDLLRAMMARLKADAAVAAFVGARIFDRPPDRPGDRRPDSDYPYLSLGPSTSIPDDFDCRYGEELGIQFDVWTSGAGEAFGSAQCRKISDAVKRSLHDAEIDLTDNALVSLQWQTTLILDDPDPALNHGVVRFAATVETP